MPILLTEDNFIVDKSIKQILENKKYLVDAFRTTKFDIIILDINLNILYIFPIIKAGFFAKKVGRKNLIKIPIYPQLFVGL